MSNKKEFQKKANALLEKHPEEKKVIIVENGISFFDEGAAKEYHKNMKFDSDPEVFFRDGYEDEDDSDLQESLHNATLKNQSLEAVLEEVATVADLESEYEPVTAETNETVTLVIIIREKLAETEQKLIEANTQLENLQKVSEENESLKTQNEALTKQLEQLSKQPTTEKATTGKAKNNETKTESNKA